MEKFPDEQFVNSLIGFGSRFKGDIDIDGLFRIDGDFIGAIKTEGKVLIGSNGRADCTINARVVVAGGVFRGTIYAQEKILILSSAIVIGNLYTSRLIVEEGALLNGSLVTTGRREGRKKAIRSRHGILDESRNTSPQPEPKYGTRPKSGVFRPLFKGPVSAETND